MQQASELGHGTRCPSQMGHVARGVALHAPLLPGISHLHLHSPSAGAPRPLGNPTPPSRKPRWPHSVIPSPLGNHFA